MTEIFKGFPVIGDQNVQLLVNLSGSGMLVTALEENVEIAKMEIEVMSRRNSNSGKHCVRSMVNQAMCRSPPKLHWEMGTQGTVLQLVTDDRKKQIAAIYMTFCVCLTFPVYLLSESKVTKAGKKIDFCETCCQILDKKEELNTLESNNILCRNN